ESACAKVQTDRKDAIADRDRVNRLRRANLRTTRQTIEQRKLQIIISIRRCAAVCQPALVSEAARLRERCACEHTKHHENCANKMRGCLIPSPSGRGPG